MRIRHAPLLLSTTTESIATGAGRCGYASPSYFSNCFRDAMLMSPSQYRERLLAGFLATPY
jgi:transcriptional regulator GlxA family with amidase domain